nr:flocculation protein FLO11-like isoform X1 [Aedes albopictus]XP_029722990.1 flocculation protein FLO11-like isoform X1 [Aedes albopictus]XP_029722991.1 flocculation protein FLO11-like isoform X1 [Aedes albopictus]XP_029722992.1 flocculation protein FLO11-like isoform X1 [Aedes albopictus]
MMSESTTNPTATPAAGTPGAGEPIPQWKKELLQRRKNLAKTIGTAATQVHDSASTVAAALTTTPTTPRAGSGTSGSPFGSGGASYKDPSVVAAPSTVADTTAPSVQSSSSSAPATSPTPSNSCYSSSANSNNNNNNGDSPASPPAATTPTSSLFGAPVFVGHSPVNEHPATSPQVLVKSAALVGTSSTNTIASHSAAVAAATRAAEVPLHAQQSHSNDGPESTSCTSSTTSRSFTLSHLHSSSGGASSSGGPVGKYAATSGGNGISASSSVDCELTTRPASSSGETSNSYSGIGEIGLRSKKNTSSASSSSSPKMVAASAEEIVYEKNPRFVGNGGGEGTTVDVDSSEELKYGPGIVSKLRCRYLSLALRQSANKQRPSLNNMRRATSLNNLLDEEGEDLSEREQSIESSKDHHQPSSPEKGGYLQQHQQQSQNGKFGQITNNQINTGTAKTAKTPDEYISTFQKSVQNSYTRSGRQTEKKNEYNRYNKQRGADSLKRARSVEALVRYDHKAWERDIQKENLYSSNDSNVIILDEISCTNGTNGGNNNCQSSVAMNKADLITDCVTIEEKIINGREKGDPKPKRLTSFIDADERPPPDVVRQTMKIFEANANRRGRPVARTNGAAGEVAAKVACYKSIISQDKPPITHPKPPLSPKKPNIIPRSASPKSNGTSAPAATNGLKEKPALPKLDIGVIRNNLETTNNLKNSASSPNHNNNNTSTPPLSVRVPESQSYRLKYESPALSPNSTTQHKVTSSTASPTTTTTNRPESPRAAAACMQNNTPNSTALTFIDSPSIPTLASKLGNLNIATSTPTSTRSSTPQDLPALPPQAPPRQPPAAALLQYATSDEEDPDDPEEDRQHQYSLNHSSDSDQSCDLAQTTEGDDYDYDYADEFDPQEVKKVSRAAMDNISRAGVTTQFRFNGQSQQNKSHLPSLGAGGGAKLLSNKKLNVDDHQSASNSSSTSSSPITVPAVAPVIAHKPPVPLSRESLASSTNNGLKPNNTNNSVTHSFNSVNSSNANISVNNNNNNSNNGSKVVINDSVGSAAPSSTPPNVSAGGASDVSKTVNLTAREIEKNQINLVKSEEGLLHNNSASSVVGGGMLGKTGAGGDVSTHTGAGAAGGDFFMAKWGGAQKATTGAGETVAAAPMVVPTKKKVKAPPPPPIEANTMVFNFSDRKDVPDYIENDGIILRPRPRELPKPGESGFVVLGDLTLETSTDPDDSWAMGPPSPCDVEFANANIVINGKSSMRNKTSRDSKFKIQFDDSLTSTFEYPSETSLLEATNGGAGYDDDVADGLLDAAAILVNSKINIAAASNTSLSNTAAAAAAAVATATTTTTGSGGGGGGGGGGLTFGDNGLLSHKNTLLSSMPLEEPPPIRPVRKVVRMRPPLFTGTSSSSSTGTSSNQNRRQLRRRPRTTSSSSSPIVVIHRRQMTMEATVISNSNARMSTLGGGRRGVTSTATADGKTREITASFLALHNCVATGNESIV